MIRHETVRKIVDAMNRHDPAAFGACYSPDAAVFDPAYPEPLRGREAVTRDMSDFVAAFPDIAVDVQRVIEDGDTAVTEFTMSGTHRGPLVWPGGHVPATGKPVKVGGAIIGRFDRSGHLVEERRYYDFAGLLSQLGLLQ